MNRKKLLIKSFKIALIAFCHNVEKKNNISPRIDGKIPDVRKYIRTFGTVKHYNNIPPNAIINIEPFTL